MGIHHRRAATRSLPGDTTFRVGGRGSVSDALTAAALRRPGGPIQQYSALPRGKEVFSKNAL